jgi:SAM-dependent methyltransferase
MGKYQIKYGGHPAKFSPPLFPVLYESLGDAKKILDPFAGIGGIFKLLEYDPSLEISAMELEPEWALQDERITLGDSRSLPWPNNYFDAIATSVAYANRMADRLTSSKWALTRVTYAAALRRDLTEGNLAAERWGDKYRRGTIEVLTECDRVLRRGGRFVLNCKNHYRNNELIDVTGWYIEELSKFGYELIGHKRVPLRGMRYGKSYSVRVDYESVVVMVK